MGYIYNKGVNKVEDDIIVIEKDMLPLREDVTLKEMCKSLAIGSTVNFFINLMISFLTKMNYFLIWAKTFPNLIFLCC